MNLRLPSYPVIRFKIARNRINHEIRRSKYYYFKKLFDDNKNNIKKQWSAVNLITQNRKSNSNHITLFNNGELIQDQKRVSDIMNKYYSKVAPNLVKNRPKSKKNYKSYLNNAVAERFFCNPTNEDEITRIMDSLDHHKAEDIYQFPIKVIKI